MSECKVDHSQEDVVKKLESQKAVLPGDVYAGMADYLKQEHTQDMLNEIFHLLKKYDVESKQEQEARNQRFKMILKN